MKNLMIMMPSYEKKRGGVYLYLIESEKGSRGGEELVRFKMNIPC